MSNIFQDYMNSLSKYLVLSKEEELRLSNLWLKNNDHKALDKLVTHNLKFVAKCALKYKKSSDSDFMDFLQEGNQALFMAAKKFDPSRKFKLITYAVHWIKAYLTMYLVKRSFIININGTTQAGRTLFFKYLDIEDILNTKDSDEKQRKREVLAKKTKLHISKIIEQEEKNSCRAVSIDSQIENEEKQTFHDITPDNINLEEQIFISNTNEIVKKIFDEAINQLPEKEKTIIQRYYKEDGETYQAIGNSFHISRERVRQIHNRALIKLKTIFEKEEFIEEILA